MTVLLRRDDLLKTRLNRFTRMLHGVEDGDPRAIHRTRVASRRLRELLPVLQLEGTSPGKLTRRLRKVTKRLGVVRELDVLLELVDELRETGQYPEDALNALRDDVRGSRDETHGTLKSKKLASELRRVAKKIDTLVNDLRTEKPDSQHKRGWRWVLDARVARRAATLTAAMDGAGAVYLAERLHAVRIALKKFRYAVELSAEASGAARTPEIQTLRRAQEVLGRMRDLQLLLDRARQLQASVHPTDGKASRSLERLVRVLEDDCRRLHARYMKQRTELAGICERIVSRAGPRRVVRKAG